jgi:hypothetical protein
MTRSSEMNKIVKLEATKIPKHPEEHQSLLRTVYNMLRLKALGKYGDQTQGPGEVMQAAVALVMEEHPNAELKYDKQFFRCNQGATS